MFLFCDLLFKRLLQSSLRERGLKDIVFDPLEVLLLGSVSIELVPVLAIHLRDEAMLIHLVLERANDSRSIVGLQ